MAKRDMLPPFPYGAVYYRYSNPPEEDWERDYATASQDGMTVFRHWFLWAAIEVAPGRYVWDGYDRQVDLAAKNGIKTIIAEMMTIAPEWLYRRYSHARYETPEGLKLHSQMQGSCATGGVPGLCLDNDDVREVAGRFLTELVNRYRDHPGMGGYDVWNECNYRHDTCYCPATQKKFRQWLKKKYSSLEELRAVWRRPGLSEWDDVEAPRSIQPYQDNVDWLQFRIENAYDLMRWRIELIRSLDSEHPITAHGLAASLTKMAPGGADDWRAAAEVESYGCTWGSSRHGDEPWKQFHAFDLVRAGSRGKPFWHAETYAGPLWMQPQVIGKPRNEGRIAGPEDIRYWDLVSFMCGATGMLYLRWRPLLDGPLFGAFGPYGMDGSRTDRSEMVSRIGKWAAAPQQQEMWKSRPVKGDIGIVYVPETQLFTYCQQGSTAFYSQSMEGAYQGFFGHNIQADWVRIDHVGEYDLLYLPFPYMLEEATARRLIEWVENGGTLVSEGCPAYFGDNTHVGQKQPNSGLDELFGCRESYVEFTPDLLGDLALRVHGDRVWGGIFLQAYEPTSGTPVGWYDDGRIAAVENTFGKGKTLLVGTMIGAGVSVHPQDESPNLFRRVLGGKQQHVVSSDRRIKARLHDGEGGTYLWVANPMRQAIPVRLKLSDEWGSFRSAETYWGTEAAVSERTVSLAMHPRDVSVLKLA